MSRPKKKVILGPDGRPYVPPPPKQEPKPTTLKPGDKPPTSFPSYGSLYDDYVSKMLTGSLFGVPRITDLVQPFAGEPRRSLADVVREQIAAIVPEDMDTAPDELPAKPVDLTTYADAFAAARKECRHPNYEDTVYAKREAFCPDCGQFFKRPRGMFG